MSARQGRILLAVPVVGAVVSPVASLVAFRALGPAEVGRWALPAVLSALFIAVCEVGVARVELRGGGQIPARVVRAVVAASLLLAVGLVFYDPIWGLVMTLPPLSLCVARLRVQEQQFSRYGRFAATEIAALVTSASVMVVVALLTHSALALALQPVVRCAILALFAYRAAEERSSAPELDAYVGGLAVPAVTSSLRNLDYLLFSRVLPLPALGLYFAAYSVVVGLSDRLITAALRSSWAGSGSRAGHTAQRISVDKLSVGGLVLGVFAVLGTWPLSIALPSFDRGELVRVVAILSLAVPALAARTAVSVINSNRHGDALNIRLAVLGGAVLVTTCVLARPSSASSAAAVSSLALQGEALASLGSLRRASSSADSEARASGTLALLGLTATSTLLLMIVGGF